MLWVFNRFLRTTGLEEHVENNGMKYDVSIVLFARNWWKREPRTIFWIGVH